MDILICDNCGYERSTEEDGQSFVEVCGICWDDTCPTTTSNVLLCNECFEEEQPLIDPGESLFS